MDRRFPPGGAGLVPAANDRDPIWPQQHYLSPLEWEIVQHVDGTATLAQLAEAVAAADLTFTPAVLWRLHVDGLLLFRS